MLRSKLVTGLAFAIAVVLASGQAEARHRHHSYGSYGSCGSSGGSYGSCGSSGGSYGGSYGSCGSSGGSYGSCGSSGGSGGGSGGAVQPNPPTPPSNGQRPASASVPADHRVRLTLSVPNDAIVYLVDQRMTMGGTVRHFITPELQAGRNYRYPVRIEIARGNQIVSTSSEIKIRAGQQYSVVYNPDAGARIAVPGN
jgi:uncharacterized protein (TIGR03000 family)